MTAPTTVTACEWCGVKPATENTGECLDCATLPGHELAYQDKDCILLKRAVLDFLTTRSPAAESELRRLVGLNAQTVFEETENPLVALFAAQGLCYPCENPLDACSCNLD